MNTGNVSGGLVATLVAPWKRMAARATFRTTVTRLAWSALVVAGLAAGCGGGKAMSLDDRAFADANLAIYRASWAECKVKMLKNGSCGVSDLEETTRNFVAEVRAVREDGYPEDDLRVQLQEDANDLEGYCSTCVAILDREREAMD